MAKITIGNSALPFGAATNDKLDEVKVILSSLVDAETGEYGFSNGGQSTPKQVTVGITSVQLLALNTSRKYAHISNNTNNPIWIQYNAAAQVNKGIKLNIGAVWTINTTNLFKGPINAISSFAGNAIDVFEGIT